jgi:Tfp pilus assembly protein PilO
LINILALSACFYSYSYLQKQKKEIKETRKNLLIIEKKLEHVKILKSQMKEIKEETAKVDAVFLNRKNIVSFIEKLEDIAKKSDVSMQIISASLEQGNIKSPHFRINLAGDFDKLFKFIVLVENMPYLTSFKNVDITRKNGGFQCDIELILLSYLYEKT